MTLRKLIKELFPASVSEKAFETRLRLARQALANSGLDADYTVREAINRLVSENKSRGFTVFNTDYFVKHDLCHVFTNAVGGTPLEEVPADLMEPLLFAREYGLTRREAVQPQYQQLVAQRALVIDALYRSVFNQGLSKIEFEKLKQIPLAVFGLRAIESGARTRYAVMGVDDRSRFLDEFKRLCAEHGIQPAVSPSALQDIPADLPRYKYDTDKYSPFEAFKPGLTSPVFGEEKDKLQPLILQKEFFKLKETKPYIHLPENNNFPEKIKPAEMANFSPK